MIDALITARGGSKRLPKKNIRNFCGKPLISWTIEAAKNSKFIREIYVSTDSEEIAEISIKYGAKIPSLRSAQLSRDDTSSVDVVLDFKKYIESDEILLLQPTSPLRTTTYINQFMELIREKKPSQCVSVVDIKNKLNFCYEFKNHLTKFEHKDELTYLMPNGALYYTKFDILEKERKFISKSALYFIMPEIHSIDIDTIDDWNIAKSIMIIKNSNKLDQI
tara:strand:+ start:981 stop:1643 length:663 start_codon:yes stop_codon:yes gene_type:complete